MWRYCVSVCCFKSTRPMVIAFDVEICAKNIKQYTAIHTHTPHTGTAMAFEMVLQQFGNIKFICIACE